MVKTAVCKRYDVYFAMQRCVSEGTPLAGMFLCVAPDATLSTQSVDAYLTMRYTDLQRVVARLKRTRTRKGSLKSASGGGKPRGMNRPLAGYSGRIAARRCGGASATASGVKQNKKYLVFHLKNRKTTVQRFRFCVKYIDDYDVYYAYAHMHCFVFRLYVGQDNKVYFGVKIRPLPLSSISGSESANVSAKPITRAINSRSHCPLQRVKTTEQNMYMFYYNIEALSEFLESEYQSGFSVQDKLYLSRETDGPGVAEFDNGPGGPGAETSLRGVMDVIISDPIVREGVSTSDVDTEVAEMKQKIGEDLGISFSDDRLIVTKARHRGEGTLYVVHNTRFVAFLIYAFPLRPQADQ